ncbi:hypothetical protein ACU686_06120 [Yinghuangia aomiensis]
MSKLKRMTAAAVAAGALAAGALASASPAMAAGPGTASYNCSGPWAGIVNPVATQFQRVVSTGQLVIIARLTFAAPAPTDITTTLDGVGPGPSASLVAGNYTAIALSGPWATLSDPPTTIVVTAKDHVTQTPWR